MQLFRMAWRGVPLRLAETLLVAALGGLAFELAGLPAGLVSGSVIAVALAALLGRPMGIPPIGTRAVLVLVGIALGSVVTPETIRGLVAYPASIAILAIATLTVIAVTALYLRLVHGWEHLTAMLGASPGALSQVIALSMEPGVNFRAVAVVQTTRIVLLTGGLPLALTLFGIGGALEPPVQIAVFEPLELALIVAISTAAAYLLNRVGFPGAWLFGAMIASAILHGSGLVDAQLPWFVASAAMIALGAVTGSRFVGITPRLLLGYVGAALGSFAVSCTVAAAFALMSNAILPGRLADIVIAYAPGGQETMMLLALALHLDPVFVGAHHLARFLVVSLSLPGLAAALLRWQRRRGAGTSN